MAILTAGYVDHAIGTATRVALVGTATGTSSSFAQFEKMASATVRSKAAVKGYSVGTDSTNDFVRLCTLGSWYHWAGGLRKGLEVPEQITTALGMLELLDKDGDGALPIPGLSQSTQDGISGALFSDTSDTSSDARVQYFSREKLRSW